MCGLWLICVRGWGRNSRKRTFPFTTSEILSRCIVYVVGEGLFINRYTSASFQDLKEKKEVVEEAAEAAKENGSEDAPANGNGTVSVEYFPAGLVAFVPEYPLAMQVLEGPLPLFHHALCLGFELTDTDASSEKTASRLCTWFLSTWLLHN